MSIKPLLFVVLQPPSNHAGYWARGGFALLAGFLVKLLTAFVELLQVVVAFFWLVGVLVQAGLELASWAKVVN